MSDLQESVVWHLDEFDGLDIDDYITPEARERQAAGDPSLLEYQWKAWERAQAEYGGPDRSREVTGNILLNEGITEMLKILIGILPAGGIQYYDNTNARIGVGNHGDTTTNDVSASNTGLSGPTTTFVAMDATFPSVSNQTVTFKMTTSGANHQWNEWTIDNGNTANKNLNKKIESLGNKLSGTWSLTATITIS